MKYISLSITVGFFILFQMTQAQSRDDHSVYTVFAEAQRMESGGVEIAFQMEFRNRNEEGGIIIPVIVDNGRVFINVRPDVRAKNGGVECVLYSKLENPAQSATMIVRRGDYIKIPLWEVYQTDCPRVEKLHFSVVIDTGAGERKALQAVLTVGESGHSHASLTGAENGG